MQCLGPLINGEENILHVEDLGVSSINKWQFTTVLFQINAPCAGDQNEVFGTESDNASAICNNSDSRTFLSCSNF